MSGSSPTIFELSAEGRPRSSRWETRLPAVATPTRTDPAGVDPICTEPNGPCSFHEVSVAEALGQPGPVALLVSTPRFCQSDVCGPTVGLLRSALRVQSEPWSAVHAEVYMAPETGDFTTTPTVAALGLAFEPSLVVADARRDRHRSPSLHHGRHRGG